MAEALARTLLAQRLATKPDRLGEFGFSLQSMGIYASVGSPASKLSVQLLEEDGIDLSQHRSRPAIADEVLKLDRVYCMTRAHLDTLSLMLPPGRDGHLDLLDPDGIEISDPMGGTRADYRRAADAIRVALDKRLDEWA
jgi:protein-tyrosine phosphatase